MGGVEPVEIPMKCWRCGGGINRLTAYVLPGEAPTCKSCHFESREPTYVVRNICNGCSNGGECLTLGLIGPHECFVCGRRLEQPEINAYKLRAAEPDHERPTDPAPPPESSVPPLPVALFVNQHDMGTPLAALNIECVGGVTLSQAHAAPRVAALNIECVGGVTLSQAHAAPRVATLFLPVGYATAGPNRALPGERECSNCGRLTTETICGRCAVLIAEADRACSGSVVIAPRSEMAPNIPAPVPARAWHDGGSGSAPRLRVKGWKEVEPEVAPSEIDDREVAEAHAEYRRAMDAEDNHALGKMFEPVLDEIHTSPSAPDPTPSIPPLDWSLLEPALTREWREWGEAHRAKQTMLQRQNDGGVLVVIGFRDEIAAPFAVMQDGLRVETAWERAKGSPAEAAGLLVGFAAAELAKVRRSELIMVPGALGT
jgi:hypothetical protein